MKILIIDIGGTNIKVASSDKRVPIKIPSGPKMTPEQMTKDVLAATKDWDYDCISIGYPGPVVNHRPLADPHNLAPGWVDFPFQKAFGKPLRFINDADTGNFITGGTAFVMAILLVIGGLIVWWPPTLRALKSSVKILPHLRGRALELNVHRTVALYASLVLLAISLSALPLAFKWVRYSMFAAVGSPMPPAKPQSAKPAEGQQPLSMGTLWARAQALVPERVP